MVRLRNVGLSRSYRRSLIEAGTDLLRRMGKHGHFPSKTTPPQLIDGWVEQVVEEAHAEGERLYWVTLGVLGLQRGLKISGSLLRGGASRDGGHCGQFVHGFRSQPLFWKD